MIITIMRHTREVALDMTWQKWVSEWVSDREVTTHHSWPQKHIKTAINIQQMKIKFKNWRKYENQLNSQAETQSHERQIHVCIHSEFYSQHSHLSWLMSVLPEYFLLIWNDATERWVFAPRHSGDFPNRDSFGEVAQEGRISTEKWIWSRSKFRPDPIPF